MATVRKVSGTVESLSQSLANDLRLISSEAKKKYPAVREVRQAHYCMIPIYQRQRPLNTYRLPKDVSCKSENW